AGAAGGNGTIRNAPVPQGSNPTPRREGAGRVAGGDEPGRRTGHRPVRGLAGHREAPEQAAPGACPRLLRRAPAGVRGRRGRHEEFLEVWCSLKSVGRLIQRVSVALGKSTEARMTRRSLVVLLCGATGLFVVAATYFWLNGWREVEIGDANHARDFS